MTTSVQQRADFMGTFRSIEVQLMEILARWVPSTPEMEVKILFGRHIWDCAQHADALGKRAFELRAQLHFTLIPLETYQNLLDKLDTCVTTPERLAGMYEIFLPDLRRRYLSYIEKTDQLMDEPTVRIINSITEDQSRMLTEHKQTVVEIADFVAHSDAPLLEDYADALCGCEELVDYRTDRESQPKAAES